MLAGKPDIIEFMESALNAAEGQAFVLLPQSVLDEMKASIREVKDLLQGKAKQEEESQWLESESARKLLGVSQKTWQTYRDSRAIPFSQFGRKIYVKKADIEAFLQSHIIKN